MKLVVVLAVVILLLGGGYFVMNGKKSSSMTTSTTEETQPTKATSANVFTSIKDALSKSVSLECKFTDEAGRSYHTYIKNGAVRSDFSGKTEAETGSTIMKDKKMYFWNAQTAMMMTFDVEAMKPSITVTPSTKTSTATGADMMAMMEKYRESCKPAVVADSLFTPPSDIKFTDYSEMMKQIPTAPSGGAMNKQQIEEMMKKYAPSGTP